MRRAHVMMELVVVITLLLVIAAISGVRVLQAMSRPRVEDARAKLRSDLEFTRARAISTGLRHMFLLDSSTGKVAVQAFHPDETSGSSTGVAAAQEDMGRIIGKQGRTAKAMRTLLNAKATREDKRATLQIME